MYRICRMLYLPHQSQKWICRINSATPEESVISNKQFITSRRDIIKGGSFGGYKVQFFTQDVCFNIDLALFSVTCCNYSEFEPSDLIALSLLIKSKWLVSYSLPGTSTGLWEGNSVCKSLYRASCGLANQCDGRCSLCGSVQV